MPTKYFIYYDNNDIMCSLFTKIVLKTVLIENKTIKKM